LAWIAPGARAQTALDWLTEGHQQLALHQIAQAFGSFSSALATAPNNDEAHFMVAYTRLLSVVNLPAVQTLMDRMGISPTGRDVLAWQADFQRDANGNVVFPASFPDGSDIQTTLTQFCEPPLILVLQDLKAISASFTLVLPTEETPFGAATQFDYGDVLICRAFMNGLLGFLAINDRYDLNLSGQTFVEALQNNDKNLLAQYFEQHQNILTLTSPEAAPLQSLGAYVSGGADDFSAGKSFIFARTGDQSENFITFNPDDLSQLNELEKLLQALKSSIQGNVFVTAFNYEMRLNLVPLLQTRINLRSFVPTDSSDLRTIPDRLFAGIFKGSPQFTFLPPAYRRLYTSGAQIPLEWIAMDLQGDMRLSFNMNGQPLLHPLYPVSATTHEGVRTDSQVLLDTRDMTPGSYILSAVVGDGVNPDQSIGYPVQINQSADPALAFSTALGASNLTFFTCGDSSWSSTADPGFMNGAAAASGQILNGQTSQLSTIVSGPGRLSFNWTISSEDTNGGYLDLYVDGQDIQYIGWEGQVDLIPVQVELPEGMHEVDWIYTNFDFTSGSDRGWIGRVQWNLKNAAGNVWALYE